MGVELDGWTLNNSDLNNLIVISITSVLLVRYFGTSPAKHGCGTNEQDRNYNDCETTQGKYFYLEITLGLFVLQKLSNEGTKSRYSQIWWRIINRSAAGTWNIKLKNKSSDIFSCDNHEYENMNQNGCVFVTYFGLMVHNNPILF